MVVGISVVVGCVPVDGMETEVLTEVCVVVGCVFVEVGRKVVEGVVVVVDIELDVLSSVWFVVISFVFVAVVSRWIACVIVV
jgi:hypothetical protein